MSTTQPADSKSHRTNPLTQMLQGVFSDNSNIMLAAIISLLLVILFVLLLHLYAKWFLAHAHAQAQAQARRRRRRRRRPASVTVSDVFGPARFHHFHSFNLQDSPISNSPTKGLDSASIAAIPVFVYEAETVVDEEEADERELECVICLSVFEDGESGRSLPKCGHAFHVECIDMWLSSHSNCPICRAPIVEHDSQSLGSVHHDQDDSSAVLEIVIDPPSSEISENDRGTESIISTNNENDNGGVSDSVISISETSSSLLGCSLKRMFSKVFPSSNVSDELST